MAESTPEPSRLISLITMASRTPPSLKRNTPRSSEGPKGPKNDDAENKEEREQAPEQAPDPNEHDFRESSNDNNAEDDTPRHERALFKSSRFKGYLILVLASGVNFQAANISDNPSFFGEFSAIPATHRQRSYAMAVALVSIIVSSITCIAHLDSFTPMKKYWRQAFRPKSRFEAYLLGALIVWWVVALWINTGIRGIAGNGKGQYNLYFSTWASLVVCLWTMERWLVSCDFPALDQFLASWPNRAPGWIAIFFLSFGALLSIVDLYANWYKVDNPYIQAKYSRVPQMQWEWLLFATGFTILPSMGFVLVEIVRENKPGKKKNSKPQWETIMEGYVLLGLFFIWMPSVIIATTPGGAASLVGNAYFCLWACTVFVVDTCVWWIHDWRQRVLTTIKEQEKEYRNIQQEVLERSRLELEMQAAVDTTKNNEHPAKDDDDASLYSDSLEEQPIADIAGT